MATHRIKGLAAERPISPKNPPTMDSVQVRRVDERCGAWYRRNAKMGRAPSNKATRAG